MIARFDDGHVAMVVLHVLRELEAVDRGPTSSTQLAQSGPSVQQSERRY
jgi:hypothetical protein